jgi:hypothetical protein
MRKNEQEMSWKTHYSLITNPNIVTAWLKAMGITFLFCCTLLIPIFIGTGDWDAIPVIVAIFIGVCFLLTISGFGIMWIILGNSSKACFTVSADGVSYQCLDEKAGTLARMAVMAGGFFASPQAAGAGILSISNEKIDFTWQAVTAAVYDEKHLTIRLRNDYRDLLHLYCTKENFAQAAQLVQSYLTDKKRDQSDGRTWKPPEKSFKQAITATALTIIASLPLYALTGIVDLHLMAPILLTAFSLATIWMIPLFGWVVLLTESYCLVQIALKFAETRELKLVTTYHYRGYEVLDAGEWILISLAVFGMVYLAWLSIRALKGRYVPLLMQDQIYS